MLACALAFAPLAPEVARAEDDWGVKRDPFDRKEINGWKTILARNPHDATALAKLYDKYRRYRTADLLKEEYGKTLEKTPDDWAALVVLGRLHRTSGDEPRALEMFNRAVAKKDSDAPTWLLIGELHKASGKHKEARGAYDKARHSSAKDREKALRALEDLALATNASRRRTSTSRSFSSSIPETRSCGSSAAMRCWPPAAARSRSRVMPRPRSSCPAIPRSAWRWSRAAARRSRA